MIAKVEFGATKAQEKLATLYGQFEYPESGQSDVVNDTIEKVRDKLYIHGTAPDYVLTRAIYDNEEGVLEKVKFTVRPAVKNVLEIATLKHEFTLFGGEDFFDKFIKEMAEWFDTYEYHAQLQENIDELNNVVTLVIEENEIPNVVKFTLGDGIEYAEDNYALVGLSAEVVEGLSLLGLFDQNLENRREHYKAIIHDTLVELDKAYQIVKAKTGFTKDLQIYTRRSLTRELRRSVNRKIDFVRVGVGYIESKGSKEDEESGYFAVLVKEAVTEERLAEFDQDKIVVTDNADASSKEQQAGQTKIVTYFLISPFDKGTGAPVELSLDEALSVTA